MKSSTNSFNQRGKRPDDKYGAGMTRWMHIMIDFLDFFC